MAITLTNSMWTADNRHVQTQETIAVGATLKVWPDSIQIMSDVWEMTTYAEYWDEAEGKVKMTPCVTNGVVDATPEVLAKVEKFFYELNLRDCVARAEEKVKEIIKGSTVKVVAGRQGKGEQGKVVVMIERPYRMGWRSTMARKVGIATSDVMIDVPAANGKIYKNHKDMVWAWARNCELIEVPEVNLKECEEIAREKTVWDMRHLKKA